MKSGSNFKGQILLDACYIKSGGGYVYLKMMSDVLSYAYEVIILSNRKYDLPYKQIMVKNILSKEINLYRYRKLPTICLSNVPSLWKSYSIFFLHQRYYVDPEYYNFDSTIKLKMKRLFFRIFICTQKNIYVQTKSMQRLCDRMIVDSSVNPFLFLRTKPVIAKKSQVVFINDNVNHKRYFENTATLEKLMSFGLDLIVVGEELLMKGVKNVGRQSHDEVLQLFSESVAFVSFSKFESLGLPLIEAALHSCACFCYSSDFTDELLKNYICIDKFNELTCRQKLVLKPSILRDEELFNTTKEEVFKQLNRELCER